MKRGKTRPKTEIIQSACGMLPSKSTKMKHKRKEKVQRRRKTNRIVCEWFIVVAVFGIHTQSLKCVTMECVWVTSAIDAL